MYAGIAAASSLKGSLNSGYKTTMAATATGAGAVN